MIEYPRWGAVMAMTVPILITLSVSAEGQTAAPSPNPAQGETTNQGVGANTNNSQTTGGELEQVTVTGYLIPRVGEGPQPVATLNQDFIQKQAYQTVNDVLNNYPGSLSGQNAQTFGEPGPTVLLRPNREEVLTFLAHAVKLWAANSYYMMSTKTRDVLSNPAGVGPYPRPFSFLNVKTAKTSVQLTWTPVEVDTGYLVFSQEVYGVHFTKRNSFRFVGLEPGRTYNVFVLAVGQGPECIAFTAFETGA